jgi:outer membrane receptor protein involved in Fe transport
MLTKQELIDFEKEVAEAFNAGKIRAPVHLSGGNEDQRGMQEGDAAQPGAYNARGFSIGEPRRDGLLRSSTAGFNGFDVESAEAVNGSNNLLYGSGDPGGIVVINTKRARVNQRAFTFSTKFDSEGSHTHTADLNYGARKIAFRLNLLENADRYYRPILGLDQRGLQAALTLRPYRWISIFSDYRFYERAAIIASGATIRTPAGFVLNNGVTMDNQSPAYITGLGGSERLNNLITLRNQDSLAGVIPRQHWINKAKGVNNKKFKILHNASVVVNIIQILLLVYLTYLLLDF